MALISQKPGPAGKKEQPVYMGPGERVGHTLILGTTRVGKTRLAEILITQDIRRGDVVIVFDPKGDADLMELGDRPDANKVRRPIQNIEPLLVKYAYHYLLKNDVEGWGAEIQAMIDDQRLTKMPRFSNSQSQ